jgi:hypothetical protein
MTPSNRPFPAGTLRRGVSPDEVVAVTPVTPGTLVVPAPEHTQGEREPPGQERAGHVREQSDHDEVGRCTDYFGGSDCRDVGHCDPQSGDDGDGHEREQDGEAARDAPADGVRLLGDPGPPESRPGSKRAHDCERAEQADPWTSASPALPGATSLTPETRANHRTVASSAVAAIATPPPISRRAVYGSRPGPTR